jgi:hypothetical protein
MIIEPGKQGLADLFDEPVLAPPGASGNRRGQLKARLFRWTGLLQ